MKIGGIVQGFILVLVIDAQRLLLEPGHPWLVVEQVNETRSSNDSNAIILFILNEGNRPTAFPPRLDTILPGRPSSFLYFYS
jgi:hypothetical protein